MIAILMKLKILEKYFNMYGYIYKTTNLINNKIYVGQHTACKFDNSYFGSGKILKKAISKYGIDNFKCELLEECESLYQLNEKEIYWIKELNCLNPNIGYNIANGGHKLSMSGIHNPMYGKTNNHSNLTKFKISAALKEYYKKNSGYWKDKHHSKETKLKMSISRKGLKYIRHNEKYQVWNKGKSMPEEHKLLLSIKHRNKRLSQETKQKISNSLKGRVFSEEHKRKLSDSAKHRKISDSTKIKISNNKKGQLSNTIWITDGKINKRIILEEFNNYNSKGFYKGRTKI